jgi:hypothetical protein
LIGIYVYFIGRNASLETSVRVYRIGQCDRHVGCSTVQPSKVRELEDASLLDVTGCAGAEEGDGNDDEGDGPGVLQPNLPHHVKEKFKQELKALEHKKKIESGLGESIPVKSRQFRLKIAKSPIFRGRSYSIAKFKMERK